MKPPTEVNADFTLEGVTSLDDAVAKAYSELAALGITEQEHTFTIGVRLYVGERLQESGGSAVRVLWNADITMRGRVK